MNHPNHSSRLWKKKRTVKQQSRANERGNRNRRGLGHEPLEDRHLLTSFVVTGNAQWTDSAGGQHNVPLAEVALLEHDGPTSTVIASGQTDLAGNYRFDVNFDDGAGDGNPDISVRILTRSPAADVKQPGGATYFVESAVTNEVAEGATVTYSPVAGNAAANVNETAFSVHHAFVMIGQYAGNLAGTTPSQIDVNFGPTATGSFFRSSDPSISLLFDDRWDWDVIHHEYGHYFMNIHGFESNPGGSHSSSTNLSNTRGSEAIGLPLAWGEGWPTFFALSGQSSMGASGLGIPKVGDTVYDDTIDASLSNDIEALTGVGEDNEQSVMSALWDAFDTTSAGSETDNVSISDRTIFGSLKNAAATTVGAAWEAMAQTLDTAGKARLGEVFGHNNIAPSLNGPADNTPMSATPLTFTWDKNGGGSFNPLNDFRIKFYSSDFNQVIFQKDLGDVNTYTPDATDWATIRSTPTVNWVVEGRNTTGVATPGGTLGYYWSGARTLGGVAIAMVIDDTGSMSEEIAGVRAGLEQYIDAVKASLAPGEEAPTIELLTFKDSVTTRISSNDLDAVRNQVSALRASGGGDCPEFSAHGLEAAVASVAPGGTILLATDAAPQPGVDLGSVLAEMRAKGITLNTILTGDCSGISSSGGSSEGGGGSEFLTSFSALATGPTADAVTINTAATGAASVGKPSADGSDDEDEGGGVRIFDSGQPAIDDHSNSTAGATKLVEGGQPVIGRVGEGADTADFFSIDLPAGTRRAIEISEAGSVRVELLAPDGSTVLASRFISGNGFLIAQPTETGEHFVRVTNGRSGAHAYQIAVSNDPLAGLTSAVDVFSTISSSTGGTFLVRDDINFGDPDDFVASIFNVLASTLGPSIIAANPTNAPRGTTLAITLEGRGTNWRSGESAVSFNGAGIQVLSVDVTSPTLLSALVQVDAGTPLGTYDATVTTNLGAAPEVATGLRVLEITPATTAVSLLTVTPGTLTAGSSATLDLFGTNVTWDASTAVTLGEGVNVDAVRVISPTQLEVDVTVDAVAEIGFRTASVTTSGTNAVLPRAVFVETPTGAIPQVLNATPSSGDLGRELSIKLQAANTNFVDGTTTADFGGDVEVVSVKVDSPTEATVQIRIGSAASPGFRNVSLTTGGETAVLIGGFFVGGATTVVPVNEFSPVVDITTPNGQVFPGGGFSELSATATDVEDGDVSGELSWTSSRDGFIGIGSNLQVRLTEGQHKISALSTDSGGLITFDSIIVTVASSSSPQIELDGESWGSPAAALSQGTIVASSTANRLSASFSSLQRQPPTLQLQSTSGATLPFAYLSFWNGRTAQFQTLQSLPAGSYRATVTSGGESKILDFSIVDGTSNSVLNASSVAYSASASSVDSIFSAMDDDEEDGLTW